MPDDTKLHGKVLSIAGSDPSGGAGIQADIKTITALGGYAMTAITSLTVQNTRGVTAAEAAAPDLVRDQMLACIEDIGVDCFKSGMLHHAGIIRRVAEVLTQKRGQTPYVLDPVMVSTSGHQLLDPEARDCLVRDLLPLATLVTPNRPEAVALSGLERIETLDDMRRAGEKILSLGAGAVLIKGGHMPGERLVDLLLTRGEEYLYESARLETRHTHGTGCTLASAIATGLAQGLSLPKAVGRGHRYVARAIATAPGFGGGHGPLNHLVSAD